MLGPLSTLVLSGEEEISQRTWSIPVACLCFSVLRNLCSRLRILHCSCSSLVTAVVWVRSLAWELPHAAGAAKKGRQRETKQNANDRVGKYVSIPLCRRTRALLLKLCSGDQLFDVTWERFGIQNLGFPTWLSSNKPN